MAIDVPKSPCAAAFDGVNFATWVQSYPDPVNTQTPPAPSTATVLPSIATASPKLSSATPSDEVSLASCPIAEEMACWAAVGRSARVRHCAVLAGGTPMALGAMGPIVKLGATENRARCSSASIARRRPDARFRSDLPLACQDRRKIAKMLISPLPSANARFLSPLLRKAGLARVCHAVPNRSSKYRKSRWAGPSRTSGFPA